MNPQQFPFTTMQRKDWQIDNHDRFIKSLKKEAITRSILTGLTCLVIGIIIGMNLQEEDKNDF